MGIRHTVTPWTSTSLLHGPCECTHVSDPWEKSRVPMKTHSFFYPYCSSANCRVGQPTAKELSFCVFRVLVCIGILLLKRGTHMPQNWLYWDTGAERGTCTVLVFQNFPQLAVIHLQKIQNISKGLGLGPCVTRTLNTDRTLDGDPLWLTGHR